MLPREEEEEQVHGRRWTKRRAANAELVRKNGALGRKPTQPDRS